MGRGERRVAPFLAGLAPPPRSHATQSRSTRGVVVGGGAIDGSPRLGARVVFTLGLVPLLLSPPSINGFYGARYRPETMDPSSALQVEPADGESAAVSRVWCN